MNLKRVLILLSVASLPLYLVRWQIGVPTTLHELIVWSALIILTALNPKEGWQRLRNIDRWILAGIALIVLGSFFGLTASGDKLATLGLIKGFIITPLVLGLLVWQGDKETKKSAIFMLLAVGAVIGAQAAWQVVAGQVLPDNRAVGIYGKDADASPNYLALFLAPITALGINITYENRRSMALLMLSMFSLLGVIASRSRAGAAITALMAVFILISKLKSPVWKKTFGALAILFALAGALYWGSPDLSASEQSGRTASSNNIRYEIWKTTIKDILPQYWVTGVGMGQFQNVFTNLTKSRVNYPEYIAPKALTAHNLFLSAWMNLGVIGLIGLIIIFVRILSIHNSRFIISDSGKIVLWTVLLLGIFDTPVFKNDLGGLFWLAVFLCQTKEAKK